MRLCALMVLRPSNRQRAIRTAVLTATQAAARVEQHGRSDVGKIAISTDEWPALRQAIDTMIEECRSDEPSEAQIPPAVPPQPPA